MPSPAPTSVRRLVPLWMWLTFTLGMVPLGMIAAAFVDLNASLPQNALLTGAGLGSFLALPMAGVVALSGRFFHGTTGRVIGILGGAVLILLLVTAAFFVWLLFAMYALSGIRS